MALVVVPISVRGLGNVDVGCFAYCVLAGVCTTDLYVDGIAAVVVGDDDVETCIDSETRMDLWSCAITGEGI